MYPLFNNACDLAHHFWGMLLQEGDMAVDATLGNGHDALFLAGTLLKGKGSLCGFDIQERAIQNTWELLKGALSAEELTRVTLYQESHDRLTDVIKGAPKLIVYNLGYLPGGDKSLTTNRESTLLSVQQGMQMLAPGGALSIVCYPGHAEGAEEEKALLEFFSKADTRLWSVSHFQFLNRKKPPSLLLVQKKF